MRYEGACESYVKCCCFLGRMSGSAKDARWKPGGIMFIAFAFVTYNIVVVQFHMIYKPKLAA